METTKNIRTLETKSLKVRSLDDGVKQISGYALTFNEPSLPLPFIEYIKPEALDELDLSQVLLLYGHDYNNILARADSNTLTTKVDDKGLYFEATLTNTQLANDVYSDIEAGNVKGCSFGFDLPDQGGDTWATDDQGNTIHVITQIANIGEISLTPIPAYAETSVQIERSYREFLEKGAKKDMAENQKVKEELVQPETPTESEKAVAPAVDTSALERAINNLTAKFTDMAENSQKRDDGSDEIQDDAKPKPTEEPQKRDDDGDEIQDDSKDKTDEEPETTAKQKDNKKEGTQDMAKDITPNNKTTQKEQQKRDFAEFLKTGQLKRDVTGGIGLNGGKVLIPETILPAEHEQHQFTRLGNLVRNISVSTTTGKLPVFQTSSDILKKHTEFGSTVPNVSPEIKPVTWDLGTFTGSYVFSQELLTDSSYDWQSELSQRLTELRDNTDDSLIITALTTGITPVATTDLIADLKKAINSDLKPVDAQNASIILSQSAYNLLDQMKDTEGRPLVQPDVTKATGQSILGKQVVIIDDLLFPNAKAGDINVIVAPLQKAVIKFKNAEITGQFQDTYDVWYKQLGIFLREDVEQARPDLIVYITESAPA